MEKDNNEGQYRGFFSKKLRAGRKTYFFDVKNTKAGDYFLTITETRKKFDGYDSHKIFLYKEDFKKFMEALNETVDYIKTELMPDYDYDAERQPSKHFSERPTRETHKADAAANEVEQEQDNTSSTTTNSPPASQIADDEQMDWN